MQNLNRFFVSFVLNMLKCVYDALNSSQYSACGCAQNCNSKFDRPEPFRRLILKPSVMIRPRAAASIRLILLSVNLSELGQYYPSTS